MNEPNSTPQWSLFIVPPTTRLRPSERKHEAPRMVAPAASSRSQEPPHRRGRQALGKCHKFSGKKPSARSPPARHKMDLGQHTTSSCTRWGPATSWSLGTWSPARDQNLSDCSQQRTRGWRRTRRRWSSLPAANENIRTSPRISGSRGTFCTCLGKRLAAQRMDRWHNPDRRCDTNCNRTHSYPARQDHLCTRPHIAFQRTASCMARPSGSHPTQVPRNSLRSTTGQRCPRSSQEAALRGTPADRWT
mmetsp:Transcript_35327/g.80929  ORF Transcript_35327/g.80929 Transcript_35327/m.80929 type:complete len:247 (-) Transcript_35327:1261-2001(-)